VLTAQVDRSACVTRNETREVRESNVAANGAMYLIAHNGADGEFRCVLGELAAGKEAGAPLPQAARAALGVQEGDTVRCVPLHQSQQDEQSGDAR
jgi:arginine N-succinyltransferase